MRILHLVQNFPPEFSGGTERYVLHLARSQQAGGHEVTVYCGSEETGAEGRPRPFVHEGLRGVRYRRLASENYAVVPRHPRLGELIEIEARGWQPDVVHLHHWFHLDLDLARRFHRLGVPVFLTLHDFYSLCPRFFRTPPGREGTCPPAQEPTRCESCLADEAGLTPRALGEAIRERTEEFRAEFAALSGAMAFSATVRTFFDHPGGPSPLHLLPPGTPGGERWRRAARPAPSGPPWRVGYWGGICRAKGLDLLVEALASPELARSCTLDLWGPLLEPDFVADLEHRADQAGLPLTLHGPCPWEELPDRVAGLHLAAFPSRCLETYGLGVDEALLAGVPVLVSDAGALTERIGVAGRAFTSGSVTSLRAGLEKMLLTGNGAAKWRGREHRVPAFTDHLDRVEEVYRSAAPPLPPPQPGE